MLHELARAKVNLTLEVVGRRLDGYHELASLVAFADIGDSLTLQIGAPIEVRTTGPFARAITGENLIAVALQRLHGAVPALQLGSVVLDKQLPVAAGIGGGSADAAALLRAVARANPDAANRVDWAKLAIGLGADVPVCLANRTAWMTGIGDRVMPLRGWPTLGAVLVNPMVQPPADKTAQVFRRLAAPAVDARDGPMPPSSGEPAVDFLAARGNALEPAAIAVMPVTAAVKSALLALSGCRYAAVSGAGPTCFGIFDDPTAAAVQLVAEEPSWWVRAVRLGDPAL